MSFVRTWACWPQPALKRSVWAAHRGTTLPAHCSGFEEAGIVSAAPSSARADIHIATGLHSGLSQAAYLLSVAASNGDDDESSQMEQLAYQLRLTAVLWWQALLMRQRFVTLTTAARCGQGGAPVGVVSLTPNAGTQAIPRPLPSPLLTLRIGVVSNMAVERAARRRGYGRALLRACEWVAAQQGAYDIIALLVHEYNEPALRLYQSSGYTVVPSWADPDWLDRAQKGQVGPMRRLLMIKPLSSHPQLEDLDADVVRLVLTSVDEAD